MALTNQEKLDDTHRQVNNNWAGIWDGGVHKGVTYSYGILPIVVETQRRQAANQKAIMDKLDAILAKLNEGA